jgi:hypothetical protein
MSEPRDDAFRCSPAGVAWPVLAWGRGAVVAFLTGGRQAGGVGAAGRGGAVTGGGCAGRSGVAAWAWSG